MPLKRWNYNGQDINWNDPESIARYCPEDEYEYLPEDEEVIDLSDEEIRPSQLTLSLCSFEGRLRDSRNLRDLSSS